MHLYIVFQIHFQKYLVFWIFFKCPALITGITAGVSFGGAVISAWTSHGKRSHYMPQHEN